jgi:hypothetical protein
MERGMTIRRPSGATTLLLLALAGGSGIGCGSSTHPAAGATTVLNFTTLIAVSMIHPGTPLPRFDLELRASYEPTGGPPVAIGNQTITLATVASQTQGVSLPIDLTPCLLDNRGRSTPATCPVHIVLLLWLVNNGVKLDYQMLGPIPLSPGAITTLPGPVTVAQVVGLDVVPPAPTVASGDTVSLDARFFTISGDTVTRPVVWGTDRPSIARVDTAGVITGVAPGQATITAYWGEGQASFSVSVEVMP